MIKLSIVREVVCPDDLQPIAELNCLEACAIRKSPLGKYSGRRRNSDALEPTLYERAYAYRFDTLRKLDTLERGAAAKRILPNLH